MLRCDECSFPTCSGKNCKTCKSCKHVNCIDPHCSLKPKPLNPRELPKTKEEVLNFRCQRCLLTCIICKTDEESRFSKSAMKHKSYKTQKIRCIECSHPACTNPGCITCQSCRDVKCKRLLCAKTPAPLNSRQQPTTEEEVQNFKCANCRADASTAFNCIGCHKAKHCEAFDAANVKAYLRYPQRVLLLCLECKEGGRSVRDVNLYSCHLCTRELGRLKFAKKDMENFLERKTPPLRCTDCKLRA